MNQQLEQKNITISGVEDAGWGLKIKDANGMVFNVPKMKKGTQEETAAFQALKNLQGYGMGMVKAVKFVTVPNSQGGQSRYVRIIGEPQAEKSVPGGLYDPDNAKTAIPEPKMIASETDWEEIAFKKCKYGFLIELFKQGVDNEQKAEETAERWAEMSMRRLKDTEKTVEEESIPLEDMDEKIEEAPFF